MDHIGTSLKVQNHLCTCHRRIWSYRPASTACTLRWLCLKPSGTPELSLSVRHCTQRQSNCNQGSTVV